MHLEFDDSAEEFLRQVTPALSQSKSLHSFILSFAERYRQNGGRPALLVRGVRADGGLAVAALQTESDRSAFVSMATTADAAEFARLLADRLSGLHGLHGPLPVVEAFEKQWCAAKRVRSKLIANQRAFQLTAVRPPRPVPGSSRVAQAGDRDVVFRYLREFAREAIPHDPRRSDEELYRDVDASIGQEQFYLWEDAGAVVCLVGTRRETPTERWIAPVYTPMELRGRGYASALVAAVSQRIVDSGKVAMLFTDLANPTSNSVYQKIGYEPLADFKQVEFSAVE